MASCDYNMIGNTTMLLRMKEAPPRVPYPNLTAVAFFSGPRFREKHGQGAAVPLRPHFDGNSEGSINTPPELSQACDPFCLLPNNDLLWTFTSFKADLAPYKRNGSRRGRSRHETPPRGIERQARRIVEWPTL
jgi:hypothetical protein